MIDRVAPKFHKLRAAAETKLVAMQSSQTDMESEDFFSEEALSTLPGGPPRPYPKKNGAGMLTGYVMDLSYRDEIRAAYHADVKEGVKSVSFTPDAFAKKWPEKLLAMIAVVLDLHPWIVDARQARNTDNGEAPEEPSGTGEELDASASEDDAESSAGPTTEAHAQLQPIEAVHAALREERARSAQLTAKLRTIEALLASKESNAEVQVELVSCKTELELRNAELESCNLATGTMREELQKSESCNVQLTGELKRADARNDKLKEKNTKLKECNVQLKECNVQLTDELKKVEARNDKLKEKNSKLKSRAEKSQTAEPEPPKADSSPVVELAELEPPKADSSPVVEPVEPNLPRADSSPTAELGKSTSPLKNPATSSSEYWQSLRTPEQQRAPLRPVRSATINQAALTSHSQHGTCSSRGSCRYHGCGTSIGSTPRSSCSACTVPEDLPPLDSKPADHGNDLLEMMQLRQI